MYHKICVICKKRMSRKKKSEAMRKNWFFCSRKCKAILVVQNNKKRILPEIKKLCIYCKKEFVVRTKGERMQMFCSKKCSLTFLNKSDDHKKKVSNGIKGSKHYSWQGGISIRPSKTSEWKIWRKEIFERDGYTCKKCGQKGVKLHPHHKKEISLYPDLMYLIENGETLCIPCHKLTDNYGAKARRYIRNQYMKKAISI